MLKELLGNTVSKERAFQIIVVHKLDRLFRDSAESATTKAILKRERVRLISVPEPVVGSDSPKTSLWSTSWSDGGLLQPKSFTRNHEGAKQRASNGHLVFRPPYGYRQEVIERQQRHKRTRTISRPVVDEKAAPVVQRVFELYDQGLGYKSIAMKLRNGGIHRNSGLQPISGARFTRAY